MTNIQVTNIQATTDSFIDEKVAGLDNKKIEPYNEDIEVKEENKIVKSEAEKRLVRKINYTLLPFLGICNFIQFADKTSLGLTAVLGIRADANLTGSQFSWLGSLFFLGYISFQFPNNYLLQKFPISKYLGTLLVLWGVVMVCTSLCTTFAELAVCRVLLGLFEAGTYPCLMILINTMYRRSEQSAAYGYLWSTNGFSMATCAALAYGISYIHANGLKPWKWLFIIWGSLTIFIGILVFFFLPDSPTSFMFRLTEEEKKIVEERTRDNAVVRVREFKRHHIWEAIKEPRLWILSLCTLCNNFLSGGINVFNTTIISGLGFSGPTSILFTIPNGIFGGLVCYVTIYVTRRSGQICLGGMVSATISLIGTILLAALPNTGVKLIGYYLAWVLGSTSFILVTLVSSNVTGYTKKIFYNGVTLVFYTLGNFIGPQLMLDREAPVFKTGMIVYCVSNAAIVVLLFINRQLTVRENERRLANMPTEKYDTTKDLTDKENITFIYKL